MAIKPEHAYRLATFCERTGRSFQGEIDEAIERHIVCALPAVEERIKRHRKQHSDVIDIRDGFSHRDKKAAR